MTNRTVAVSLTAQVSSYIANFKAAENATVSTGNAALDAQKKFENQNAAMTKVGVGLVAFGAIAAAAVGLAVAKYAEFDEAMSSVQAATHESTENMALLRDAAIEAGSSTVFTAKEAANAIEELAKAGVSTADILGGGLAGALDLASAGGIAVADAAATAATAMTQFSLSGEQVPHIADLLAAGAGKAQGSVDDLSQALNQGGLVASQAGFSIEETTGALAAFAAAGLIGSDAGTSLKTAILALENPSSKAAGVMKQYGLNLYDTQGNMLSMADIANQLQTKLGGLTDEQRNAALATIFGNDAVRAANVLYANGSAGITGWTDKVNDTGYAAETARIKLDNLNGDVEKLGGAFDSVLIKTGSGANDALRLLVQTATDLVDGFGSLPPIAQQGALALASVAAAAALAGGAFLIGVPKVAEFASALQSLAGSDIPAVARSAQTLTRATSRAGSALSATAGFLTGPWGVALAAASVGVSILASALKGLQATSEEITNSLKTANSAAEVFAAAGKGKDAKWLRDVKSDLSDLPSVLQASADQSENLFARFDSSNFGAFDELRSIGEELGNLAATDLPSAQRAFNLLAQETDGSDQSLWRLLNTMPAYKDALTAVANEKGIDVVNGTAAENQQRLLNLATEEAATVTDTAAQAYVKAADSAQDLQQQILDLIDAVNQSNKVGQDAISTNAAYQQTIAGVDEYIAKAAAGEEGYAFTLDEATAAGSANADMLRGMAADSQAAALAQYNLDGNTAAYRATLDAGRAAVIDRAQQLGATAEQAQALADKIYAIPKEREFQMIAETNAAAQEIQRIKDLIDSVPRYRQTSIGVSVDQTPFYVPGNADGGAISGAGGPRDDRVLRRLSNGEHVLTAADVTAMGGQDGVYAFRSGLHSGQGYANGGAVGTRVSVSPSVSLAGATMVLKIGDREIVGIVQEQIVAADAQSRSTVAAGVRTDYA